MEHKQIIIRRGDIFLANCIESYKYVLKGERPVIILSNYLACENSPLLNVVPITSNLKALPSHVIIGTECGLNEESIAVCEQIFPISKNNLLYYIGKCSYSKMAEIKKAIDIQLGFSNNVNNLKDLEEVKRQIENIEELDRYLETENNVEIIKERGLALKCLEHFCINHSINSINLSRFYAKDLKKEGWEVCAEGI